MSMAIPQFQPITSITALFPSFLLTKLLLLISICDSIFIVNCHSTFTIKEASIEGIQRAFRSNILTSRQLVESYIKEIQTLKHLRAVIEVNPDVLDQADKADSERKMLSFVEPLGGLHGIPILLKDNIATKDKLNTTAGSFSLMHSVVPRDAGVVRKLRKSGAIIMGKASLSEWANFRGTNIPPGWCARGGQGLEKTCVYNQNRMIESEKTSGSEAERQGGLLNLMKLDNEGFKSLMITNNLDAVVTPGYLFATVLVIGGHPGITVPAGYEKDGTPVGICFGGLRGSEPKLIEIAYGFEQITLIRKPPPSSIFIGYV